MAEIVLPCAKGKVKSHFWQGGAPHRYFKEKTANRSINRKLHDKGMPHDTFEYLRMCQPCAQAPEWPSRPA